MSRLRVRAMVAGVLAGVLLGMTGPTGVLTAGATTQPRAVQPRATATAQAASADSGGSITPNAPQTALDVPAGAVLDWTFPASRGQFVHLSVGDVVGSSWCTLGIAVVDPDDTTLYDNSCVESRAQLDRATIVHGGEHRVRITNTGDTDVTVPLALSEGRDRDLTLAPDVRTRIALALPGQRVVQHVAGHRGETPVITLTGVSLTGMAVLTLRDALGRQLAESFVTASTREVSWYALPGTGDYTVTLAGYAGATGHLTEELSLRIAPVYRLSRGVPTVIAPVPDDGGVDLDFWVPAGRSIVLTLDNARWGGTLAYLFSPDGMALGSDWLYSPTGSTDFGGRSTTRSGTYHVRLSRALGAGATVRVDTGSPVPGGSLALGAPTRLSVARPGASRVVSFEGSAGQRPVVAVSSPSWSGGSALAYVSRPDGTTLGAVPVSEADPFTELPVLDATGTWTLTLDPEGATTGAVTLRLDLVRDQTVTVTPGAPVHLAVTEPGQNVSLRFVGSLGQRPTLRTTASSWSAPAGEGGGLGTELLTPGGGRSSSWLYATADGTSFSDADPLFDSGTWTLVVDPQGAEVGAADLTLSLVDDVTVPAERGVATTLAVWHPGQVVTGSIRVPFGFRLTATVVSSTWSGSDGPAPTPRVGVRQSGNVMDLWDLTDSTFARTDPSPFGSTPWSVILDPEGDVTGSLTVVLDVVRDVIVPVTLGVRTTASIVRPGQSVLFTFTGGGGQVLPWSASATVPGEIVLRGPTGSISQGLGEVDPAGRSDVTTLGETGPYGFEVKADGAQTGSVTVRLG